MNPDKVSTSGMSLTDFAQAILRVAKDDQLSSALPPSSEALDHLNMTDMIGSVQENIASLRMEMLGHSKAVGTAMAHIERRVAQLDGMFDGLSERFSALDAHFDGLKSDVKESVEAFTKEVKEQHTHSVTWFDALATDLVQSTESISAVFGVQLTDASKKRIGSGGVLK